MRVQRGALIHAQRALTSGATPREVLEAMDAAAIPAGCPVCGCACRQRRPFSKQRYAKSKERRWPISVLAIGVARLKRRHDATHRFARVPCHAFFAASARGCFRALERSDTRQGRGEAGSRAPRSLHVGPEQPQSDGESTDTSAIFIPDLISAILFGLRVIFEGAVPSPYPEP